MSIDVAVGDRTGTVADLHGFDPFESGPVESITVWRCRPTDDAIVLGSAQPSDLLDLEACQRAGLAVVRRRSGGGAVIVRRDRTLWVDIVAPLTEVTRDVRSSMLWAGAAWSATIAPLTGHPLVVHDGGMVSNPWSDLVCFAGVGPGEVLVGDRKLVGLSQRRTRHGIRIQSLIPSAPVATEYRSLFRPPVPPDHPTPEATLRSLDSVPLDLLAEHLVTRISPV